MTPEELERERAKSAMDLHRVADEARDLDAERSPESVLGAPVDPTLPPGAARAEKESSKEWNPPAPPDLRAVNEWWRIGSPDHQGTISALLGRSADRDREAQNGFNSHQVQLDNHLVTWTAGHFEATHRHYDRIIAEMQQRMDDIDARHQKLGQELVRHVHEMARRVDVVLGEGEKGRVSHEAALRSVRERLRALEEKLR